MSKTSRGEVMARACGNFEACYGWLRTSQPHSASSRHSLKIPCDLFPLSLLERGGGKDAAN